MDATPHHPHSPANSKNRVTQPDNSEEPTSHMLDKEFLMKLDRPWKILKNGAKLGIGGFKRFSVIVSLFVIVNLLLFGFGIYRVATTSFSWGDMGMLLFMALLGSAFTIWAGYRSYRYVFINVLAKIYERSQDYRQGMCAEAIARTEQLFSGEEHVTDARLKAAVGWSNSVYSFYGRIPVFFQSGVTQLLNRVPITAFLVDIKEDIKEGEQQLAAEKLHASVDGFINAQFFSTNNTRWLLWLIPLDVIMMLAIALYGIG